MGSVFLSATTGGEDLGLGYGIGGRRRDTLVRRIGVFLDGFPLVFPPTHEAHAVAFEPELHFGRTFIRFGATKFLVGFGGDVESATGEDEFMIAGEGGHKAKPTASSSKSRGVFPTRFSQWEKRGGSSGGGLYSLSTKVET